MSITKEGHRALTNKSFDVAEAPVRNWISSFTNKSQGELFEHVIKKADSIWLHPQNQGEKYVELKIKMVPKNYKHDMGDIVQEKRVQDAVQFLAYSVNTVYHPTIAKLEDNTNDIKNITLAWDEKNYIYIPQYTPPPVKEYNRITAVIRHHLSYRDNVMETAPEEKKQEWLEDYKKFLKDQKKALQEMEPLNELVNEKNEYLKSCNRISISVKKYKESQLPKNLFMRNLPKIKAPAYS